MSSTDKRSSSSVAARLPRGPHSLSREQVAANQRLRLVFAMIDVVAEKGYAASTIVDIAARAGVSRNSFYAQFSNKQECFLATYDAIMAEGMRRVQSAYHQAEGWPGRVEAAIIALFEGAIESPAAICLSLVEIAAAGAAGIERRERAMIQFAQFIRDGLELAPGSGTLPDPVLRASVGGLNRILYTRIRANQTATLLELVPDLVAWATAYYPAPTAILSSARADHPSTTHGPYTVITGGRAPGTLFPRALSGGRGGFARGVKNFSRGFVVHSQRERILDAVTNLTAAEGFTGLTVEAIATEAGVSLQAFYEHFKSKQDAFLVAYELGHAKGIGIVEQAFVAENDWRQGVRAAIAALLQYLASEPSFAHIALLDSLTATPLSASRLDKSLTSYAQMLLPGFAEAPKHHQPPPITVEAITGGLFELCSQYAAEGRIHQLGEITTHATYIALAPFIGTEEAARVASEDPSGSSCRARENDRAKQVD
jgi:AcrR family transcriptional regulator